MAGLIVAVSVGQTKIAAAALTTAGEIIKRTAEVSSPRRNADRAAVSGEIAAGLAQGVGVDRVIRIGISFRLPSSAW